MTNDIVNAVFENGVFRPLDPVHINVRDGDHVCLRIEGPMKPTSLDLASRVYAGLSESDIADIERIALDRTNFFGAEEKE